MTAVNTVLYLKVAKSKYKSSHYKKNKFVTMCVDGCQVDLLW